MKNLILFLFCTILYISGFSQHTPVEVILVGNNKGGTVSIIDANSHEVLSTIDIAPDKAAQKKKKQSLINRYVNRKLGYKYVDDLDVLPDGTTMVISRPCYADIAAFDLNSHELLWVLPLKKRPDHQVMTKDGKYLFVSLLLNQKSYKIDLEKKEIVGSYKTGRRPHSIVLNEDESLVYNGSLKGNDIVVVDTKTLEQRDHLPFSAGVRPFKITSDQKYIYSQLSYFHGLVKYDVEKKQVVKTLDLPVPEFVKEIKLKDYPFEAAHHGIGLSKDGQWMSLAGTISNYVAFVKLDELEFVKTLDAGVEPSWITDGFDGDTFFVSARKTDEVYVFSYSQQKMLKVIKVGSYPQRMTSAIWQRAQ